MQIATNDIVDKTLEHEGNYVNQDLFIAEANFKIGRPRIIQPVRAKLVPREEAPKNKTIYYSYNFFKVYKANGKLDSKVVAVFDGVGITQCLLDACEFYFENDYDIYIPNVANDLIKKVDKLGFHHILQNQSLDGTIQHKFIKPRNISWI